MSKRKVVIERNPDFGKQCNYALDTGWFSYDGKRNDGYNNSMSTLPEVSEEYANAELEGGGTKGKVGEVVMSSDEFGQPMQYGVKGARHSNDGVPVLLSEGDFVFSDTKKMKIKDKDILSYFGKGGKAQTPAKIAKGMNIKPYQNILQDPQADSISKKTAQMMVDNYMSKLNDLALIQESQKGFPQGVPTLSDGVMKMGGKYKCQYGGFNQPVSINPDAKKEKVVFNPTGNWADQYNLNTQPGPSGIYTYTRSNGTKGGLTTAEYYQMLKMNNQSESKFTPDQIVANQLLNQAIQQPSKKQYGGQPQYQSGGIGNQLPYVGLKGNRPINYTGYGELPPLSGVYITDEDTSGDEEFVADNKRAWIKPNPVPTPVPQITQKPQAPQVVPSKPLNGPVPNGFNPKTGKKPPFQYTGADSMALMNAMQQLGSVKKYLPWEAAPELQAPQYSYYSPEREIAAGAEQVNSAGNAAMIAGNPQLNRALLSQLNGQQAANVANILGKYNNMNVEQANRQSDASTGIRNQNAMMRGDRATRLFDKSTVANQQYDNSLRDLQNNYVGANINAWNNRKNLALINSENPNYYIDPISGAKIFKPGSSDAINGAGATGEGGVDQAAKLYSYYKQKYPDATDEAVREWVKWGLSQQGNNRQQQDQYYSQQYQQMGR